ncbi:MAG: SDR family NAD(P)-dependent oxidoreductase, partial [candidate division Zixibacteria bacterium]|nr:SDR family NAD(P)-dependent oxidoreductase [candidate division Zixibacteria bacterium]
MKRLENKVAVITGASLGIGRATCQILANEGAKIAATDILDSQGKALIQEIKASGGVAQYWHLNVSKEEEVKEVLADI